MSRIATGEYDDDGWPPDQLNALVADQAGVVSRTQLLDLGFSDSVVKAQLRASRWQRVYTGVFATFTGDLPELAGVWAALLLAGPGAVASHATALRLFGMRSLPDDATIHVSVSHKRQISPRPGLVVHRRCGLAAVVHPVRHPPSVRLEDAVLHVAADPARDGGRSGGMAVVADACQRRLTNVTRLRAALDRLPVLPGRRTLAGVLDDVAEGAHSFLELRYLNRVERACLTAHLVSQVLQARGWTGRPRRCGAACRLPQSGQLGQSR